MDECRAVDSEKTDLVPLRSGGVRGKWLVMNEERAGR